MPQPDNRRERGGQTASTTQKVAPSVAAPSYTSAVGSGAVNVGPALQINPNQARVVKTGGELAEAFAGLAGGVQQGIKNFEAMEQKFEEMRYNEFETDMIRQAESTNNDPQKMKSWFDSQDYQPGRFTSKRYYTARAGVNGKAYADDQNDWYRGVLNSSATMPLAERQKFLRGKLETLDENSPVYAKLDQNVRSDTAKLSDMNRKTRNGMLSKEMVADSQSAVKRIISAGASPDIVHNDYFKNVLRARNMGLVEVDDNGQITMVGTDRQIKPTELTGELNAELMLAMQERASGMDPDLVMAQFGAINYDEGFLASARGAAGRGSKADAIDGALDAGISPGDGGGGSIMESLMSAVPDNSSQPVDSFIQMFDGALRETGSMSTEQRMRWLANAETMLDDDAYGGSWEALGEKFGMDGSMMTGGMRRHLRGAIRDARLDTVAGHIEEKAPNPAAFKTIGEYETATKNFYYEAVGMMAEVSPDAMLDIEYTDKDGKPRGMTVKAENYRDFASKIQGAHVSEVSFRTKGAGPISISRPGNEVVTFGYDANGDAEGGEVTRPRRGQDVGPRQRAVKALRDADAFLKGGGGVAGGPERVEAFYEAVKRTPEEAINVITNAPDGADLLAQVLTEEEGKELLRPELLRRLSPDSYKREDGTTDMEKWKESTLVMRGMMSQIGHDRMRTLLGADPQSGMASAKQAHRIMSMIEFGPQLMDMNLEPEQLARKLDEATRIAEVRTRYPDKAGSMFDAALNYDANSTEAPSINSMRAAQMNAQILDFVNAETGGEYTNLLEATQDATANEAVMAARRAFAESNAISRMILTDNNQIPTNEAEFSMYAAQKLPSILNLRRTSSDPRHYVSPDGRSVEQHAAQGVMRQMEGNPEQLGTFVRTLFPEAYFDSYSYTGSAMPRGAVMPNNVAAEGMRLFAQEGAQATQEYFMKFATLDNPPPELLARRRGGVRAAVLSLIGDTPETAAFAFRRQSTADTHKLSFQVDEEGVRKDGTYRERGFSYSLNGNRTGLRKEGMMVLQGFNDTVGFTGDPIRMQQPDANYDGTGRNGHREQIAWTKKQRELWSKGQ